MKALGQRAELLLALEDVGDPQLRALSRSRRQFWLTLGVVAVVCRGTLETPASSTAGDIGPSKAAGS